MTRRGVVVAALIVACAPVGWWLGANHPELSGATPEPTVKGAVMSAESAPVCESEYGDTDCYYHQGDKTWYVDAHGDAHEVTE